MSDGLENLGCGRENKLELYPLSPAARSAHRTSDCIIIAHPATKSQMKSPPSHKRVQRWNLATLKMAP